MNYPVLLALVALLSLAVALVFATLIKKKPQGDDKMKDLAKSISDGAMAFLKREYRVILIFVIALAIVLYVFLDNKATEGVNEGLLTSISFVYGAFSSALAGFFGMTDQ